jgi:hypothetical protein
MQEVLILKKLVIWILLMMFKILNKHKVMLLKV